MEAPEKCYIIGIDLGTTNSAVSYVDLSTTRKQIKLFRVPQLSGPGEISELRILPSFFYIPGEHEIDRSSVTVSWSSEKKGFTGAFARDQGSKVPDRLVSSAKSWLCHAKVDRRAAILPWSAAEDVSRISPVEATAAYLTFIKDAWNHTRKDDEDQYAERQHIIITVPASFDEAARDLTVEAAGLAGIKNITLLEEPLAAFYSWLIRNDKEWSRHIRPGQLILVCDVGGGTTDFTLITLRDKEGSPVFDRIAVGDHLILGGDNMDLALARHVETRLKEGGKSGAINIRRWQALCSQCRQAKEEILSGVAESRPITLVGEGRKLISGTMSATLSRKEIEDIILDGFFPLVARDEDLSEKKRLGITEFGLPYAQDPAITRHMVRFLERHRQDVKQILNIDNVQPDLILFNGAALKPLVIQEKIRAAIRHWFNEVDEALPRVMVNPEPDLAVALGASYYGLVKQGLGIRVGSGSARAYFLGVGHTKDPSASQPEKAICLVERGTEEGKNIELAGREFHVLANQPVSFSLFSSSFRPLDRVGDLIDIDDTLTPLPQIQTVIQYGKKARETKLPVKIEANYTEIGTLALWCCSTISDHRWRLQFQLREIERSQAVSDQQVLEQSLVDKALYEINQAFSANADSGLEQLIRKVSEVVGLQKEMWPLNFIRPVADQLIRLMDARKISSEHEGRWYNLTGFCLRPGVGDAGDENRLKVLWRIFDQGPIHNKNPQVRSEWWVLWRRVAAGLSAKQQRYMSQKISTLLRPKKGGEKIQIAPQEHMEIWMAVANLELISAEDRANWGKFLLDQLSPKKSRPQYWWAISRLGAREPLYGPIDRVIPAAEAGSWIKSIQGKNWRNPRPVGSALSQIARLTGDRKRDLDPDVLKQAIEWLSQYDWSGACMRILQEVVPVAGQEESALFGESVPPGIVLHV